MKIQKIRKVKTPSRGTPWSAGIDFYIPDEFGTILIEPQTGVNIPSGIRAEIPKGKSLVFFNKSGMATRKNLMVGASVVDEDYQGEIHLHVINCGGEPVVLEAGTKLVQGLLLDVMYAPVTVHEEIHQVPTQRGSGGFGSTGK